MPTSSETNGSARKVVRLLAIGSALLFVGLTAGPAQAFTNVYDKVATESSFVVPEGLHELTYVAIGGSGGDAQDGKGGAGAKLSGIVAVTPGQTLYIEVGENGKDIGQGGGPAYNGGAAGGGGGGGASDIRTAPYAAGLSPDPRLLVAGAGGGAGATGIFELGGSGGDAEMVGGASTYSGGGAGTQTEGGAGPTGCGSPGPGDGDKGGLGVGGEGGDAEVETGPGGGGGGGYYGGGGGAGSCELGSSGGGGGSSLVPPLGVSALASPAASPLIEITWYLPSITVVAPAKGATYKQGEAVNANYSCVPRTGATLQSCIGPVANGAAIDTSTAGPHTFSVAAEDSKGKVTENVTYTVAKKPNTKIGSHPKKTIKTKKKKVKVKFGFSSDVKGATFKCKLDKGSFAKCSSPKTYKVKLGKHTFSVKAVSAGGTDPTPAKFSFKVKKKK